MTTFNTRSFVAGMMSSTVLSVGVIVGIAHFFPSVLGIDKSNIPPISVIDANAAVIQVSNLPEVRHNPAVSKALVDKALRDFASEGMVVLDRRAVLSVPNVIEVKPKALAQYVQSSTTATDIENLESQYQQRKSQALNIKGFELSDADMKAIVDPKTEADLQKTVDALNKFADLLEQMESANKRP